MKKLAVVIALFALAVPAALAAPPAGKGNQGAQGSESSSSSPAQLCKEQLRTMDAANFQSTYAPNGNGKSAMGKCVSRQIQVASSHQENAAKKCKAERSDSGFAAAHGGKTFAEFYGTNQNMRNALGKCVSKHAKQQTEAHQNGTLNAAKKCKAERSDSGFAAAHGGKTFAEFYGTNANKKNAFGKCVSKYAKQKNTS